MLPLRKQTMIHHRRNKSSTHSPCTASTTTTREHGPRASGSPQAQLAAATATPVLPAPPPSLPAIPPAPAPPAFALEPGRSHAVLNFDDPNTGATATKLYDKAISPVEEKFEGEADNLAIFLTSMCDCARCFNWHWLITVPIDDGTTRNLLTHYVQVSLDNTRAHAITYVDRIPSTTPGAEPPRDARDSGSARSHSTHLETSSSDRP